MESFGTASNSTGLLESWKQIASYFGCTERTAKRWERERGLPVHRLPGDSRSCVFAYIAEIENWRHSPLHSKIATHIDESTLSLPPEAPVPVEVPAFIEGVADVSDPAPVRRLGLGRRWLVGGIAGAAVLLTVAAAPWVFKGFRTEFPPKSSTAHASSLAPRYVAAHDAEELYLRGRYFWNLRTADGLTNALDSYTEAIVRDPSYAEAYAGLAETYDLLPQFGRMELGGSLRKAELAADRAIALNPNLADAHTAKAFALFFLDWDITDSDAEFRRALALDPDSALIHQWYASTLECRDDGPGALREIEAARRLSPTSAAIAADAALFQSEFGNYAAGMKTLREIEQTQPTLATPAWFLKELDFATGNFPDYIAETRRYATITHTPEDAAMADTIAHGWAQGGKIGLLQAQSRFLQDSAHRGAKSNYSSDSVYRIGEILVLLGRPKEALPWFREALNTSDVGVVCMEDCPWAKPLQRDPGYAALFADIRRREKGSPSHPALVRVGIRLPQ
jgi:tetratricopeptide (TPR) repeat protein